MQMKFKVTYQTGEPQEVTANFADFVMFERTWNKSVAKFDTDIRLTDLAWIAWRALTSRKLVSVPFEPDWLNSVENVELVDDEVAPAPLEQTQP